MTSPDRAAIFDRAQQLHDATPALTYEQALAAAHAEQETHEPPC